MACKSELSSTREERYNKRVKSDSDCFKIVSCEDGDCVLNQVVVVSVKSIGFSYDEIVQAKDDIEHMFEVSENTVLDIIFTWINLKYFQLKEIDIN